MDGQWWACELIQLANPLIVPRIAKLDASFKESFVLIPDQGTTATLQSPFSR